MKKKYKARFYKGDLVAYSIFVDFLLYSHTVSIFYIHFYYKKYNKEILQSLFSLCCIVHFHVLIIIYILAKLAYLRNKIHTYNWYFCLNSFYYSVHQTRDQTGVNKLNLYMEFIHFLLC